MKQYFLDATIFCHGMPMAGDTILSGKSLGGSETCAIQAAEEMSRQGHRPVIFCNTEQQHECNGVVYMPIGWVKQANGNMFPKGFLDYARSTPHDVLIIQRLPGIVSWEFQSKVNLLWQHDLATRTGPSNFHGTMWNVDRILVISEFMKRQYQEVHGGPDSVFHVTRNGIDIGLIDSVPEQERDRFKIMFTSRPERGLDIMLRDVLPRLLQREPRIQLYISRYDDVATLPLYQQCAQMAARYGDRVVNLGNLSKQELYRHYKQAWVYAYSSVFEEVSCLTLAEIAACGGVFVGPWKAALPEHKGGAPVLIRDDGSIGQPGDPLDKGLGPVSPKFCDRMADEILDLVHNDERWARLSKRGREKAERWTWEAVVKDWMDLAHQIIAERSSEPRRLVKHFLVNSDVVAARKYVKQLGDEKLQRSVDRYAERFVPFMKLEDGAERKAAMAKFYEDRSGGDNASWQTAFWADQEPRLQVLRDWIAQQGDKIGSVLDFGCAHGGYARALSNALPSLRVVGLDVSPSLIRCANELKIGLMTDGSPACNYPDNLKFIVGDEDSQLTLENFHDKGGWEPENTTGQDAEDWRKVTFDLVTCMEVLEHVPDSEAVIKKLERHCKPGGWMAFTVPHGHRERDEFVTKGVPPVHVRSFDRHDLIDLFGHRQDFQVVAFSDFKELDYDRTFSGWFMVLYRSDGQDVGQIDYERKFFLQGPRETVSVCMITNNAENTLHRALKSVVKLADEIIVIDNGPSTDSTVEMARQYTPDVRAGTSPFWCYAHKTRHQPMEIRPGQCDMAGFETPRNESIQGAWGDWIHWIDADEALLNWQDVWKYLRPNCYLGYAVNQHHLSVDADRTMRTDIPCRVFRNHRGLRFYGLVHEHAETAINGGIGPQNIVIPINIHHDGYANEDIRRGRFNRNLRLLECDRLKYPDRMLGIYLYEVRDNVHMARYAMEAAGGQVTDEVRRYCWTVVNSYRKHFLGKSVLLAQDGILYYSDALTMLGLGVEVALDIDVRQQGAHLNGGGTRCRVMDYEEAKLVTEHLLDQKFGPWRGRYIA